jgi:hypothetical protein
VGLALAVLLVRRCPPNANRPLLALLLAAAPLLPLLAGRFTPLLAFQGPVLVLVAAAALAVALVRAGALEGLYRRLPSAGRGLALFGIAFLFYATLGTRLPGPAGPQGDEPHYLAMAHSLLTDGDLDLADEFSRREYRAFFAGQLEAHTSPASPRGTIYSVHAPGLAVLVLPAYALGGYGGVRLFLSALAALTGVFVHGLLRETLGRDDLALAGWAAFTLTPPLPFYAVAVYPETPAALATAIFLLTTRRDPSARDLVLATLAAAALPWLHPKFLPLAVLGVGLTLARRGPRGARVVAGVVFAGAVAGLLVFFESIYGRAALTAAYGPGFAGDVSLARIPYGLAALLLDRQFGLLAVGPLWALAILGGLALFRWRPGDALRAALLAGATLAVGASFSMWWGGACPPARFVVPALPALAVALVPAMALRRDAAAALGGLGLAVVALAADAPRALHNRPDGESGLLRLLAPGLDLDGAWPSFVRGSLTTLLLAATILAALALAGRFGRRGLVAGGVAYAAVAASLHGGPWLDGRQGTLRVLEVWDGDNVWGWAGPLDLATLAIPLDLRGGPWMLAEGDLRISGRLDLPPGLYRVDLRGAVTQATPGSNTTRLDLTAGDVLLERVHLRHGRPELAVPLLLPVGARRLTLTAVGVQGAARLDAGTIVPEALVPRRLRQSFPWPRQAEDDRYRIGSGDVHVTALDRSPRTPDGFRLEEEAGSFVVDAPAGSRVAVRVARPRPAAGDFLRWGSLSIPLGADADVAVTVAADEGGVSLGRFRVVPVEVRSYGASMTFSGSVGGTSATASSAASPADLPSVMTTSAPPDSGKKYGWRMRRAPPIGYVVQRGASLQNVRSPT